MVIIDALSAEFNHYFPDGNLNSFYVFYPVRMPQLDDYVGVRTYGILKIKHLNLFFRIANDEQVIDEWQALLLSIVSSPKYCQIKNSYTRVMAFWSQFLKWPEIT